MRPKTTDHELGGVAETLLIPLAFRAIEAGEADPIVKDTTAGMLVDRLGLDTSRFEGLTIDRVFTMMRAREFDCYTRRFLEAHPAGTVVDIGCGLDDRLSRIDNGRVEYYALDLPEVMTLRASLFGERSRGAAIAGSVLKPAWLDHVRPEAGRACLFLAEGVFPYFREDQVKSLVLRLRDRYPGCQLVFDALSPFMVWIEKVGGGLKQAASHLHWALRRDSDLERWGNGIRLLKSWYYFADPEPRLRGMRWMRVLPPLARGTRIVSYRLGGIDAS